MDIMEYASVKRWFNHVFSSGIRSNSTQKTYVHFLARFCEYAKKNPDELIEERRQHLESDSEVERRQHEELLEKWRNYLEQKLDLARGSIVTANNIIKSFYKANYVPLMIKSPKSWVTKVKKVPTQEELGLMIRKCRKLRDQTIIICLAQSGTSLEDFVKLTYNKIEKELLAKIEPLHLAMERTKIKKKYDTFLGSDALFYLRSYLKDKPKLDQPIFHLSQRAIEYIVEKASKRVELKPHITPHNLRSFFSTRLKVSGCPDIQVEYWMGHTIPYGGAYFVPPVEEQRKIYKEYEWTLNISKLQE